MAKQLQQYLLLSVLSLFFLLPTVPVAAQQDTTQATATVPHLVNFNGTVPEAQPGTPVALKFSLYESQTGGDPIWSETQQVTPDAKGRYAVLLGAATPSGLPQNAFSAAQAKWLGVSIGDGAEQPRTILVATPYSLKASDAETLGGHPVTDFKLATNANGKPDTTVDITSITAGTGITVLNNGTASPTVEINSTYLDDLAAGYAALSANNKFTGANTFTGATTLAGTTIDGNLTITGSINSTFLNSIAATLSTLSGNNAFTGSNSFSKPITFAGTQTFPGTLTAITAGTGISATNSSGNVTVSVSPAALESTYNGVYAQLGAANNFSGTQTILSGNLVVSTGDIDLTSTESANNGTFAIGGTPYFHAAGGATNVFAGPAAGNFTLTGTNLTALGSSALAAETSGSGNTAIGANAGEYNKTGASSTYLGLNAGPDSASTGLTNATAIGANATVSESNALVLGGTGSNAVSVGIGTATPAYTLDVHGTGNFTGAVTFAGNETFTGNETITGTETVTGSAPSGVLEGVNTSSGSGSGVEGSGSSGVFGNGTGTNAVGVLASALGSGGVGVQATGNSANGAGVTGTGYVGVSGTGASTGPAGLPLTAGVGVEGVGSAGVYGTSSYAGSAFSATGVYGYISASNSATGFLPVGVWGEADSTLGVGVIAIGTSYGLEAASTDGAAAISAVSDTGYGVEASSTSGNAITATSTDTDAIVANSTDGNGLTATGGNVGVYATGTTGIYAAGDNNNYGVDAAGGTGVVGRATGPPTYLGEGVFGALSTISATGTTLSDSNSAGVFGDMANANGDGAGIIASADSNTALLAWNNSPYPTMEVTNLTTSTSASEAVMVVTSDSDNTHTPIFETSSPNTYSNARSCYIDTSANLACTGQVSGSNLAAVVPVQGGKQAAMYSVQSPENWFEDFGTARLQGGAAHVSLEALFGQTVNSGVEYHVFLTPKGDCRGLYVADETGSGFEVRELGGGKSSVSFDYRIVAKRKGYETVRMEDLTEQANASSARQQAYAAHNAARMVKSGRTAMPAMHRQAPPTPHATPRPAQTHPAPVAPKVVRPPVQIVEPAKRAALEEPKLEEPKK
jgi:hypothetical protein